jgi:putative peptidoglycan lipid II flippase
LARERFRLWFDIDLSDASSRQVLTLMAPRALGLGANQITFMIATILATGVGVGAVTSYNVAWTVMQIPLGVIGFPLGVVLLPSLSRAVASGSTREFGRLIVSSIRLLLWVMFFVTAVGVVLRRQVVTLLFDTGLDERTIALTADTLSFMLLGLAGYSLVIVFARAFYSGHDTRTPVITALLDMATAIVVGVATVGTLGLSGIALGLTAGAWVEAAALGVLLWRRTPGTGIESVFGPMAVFAIGAALAGVATAIVVRLTDQMIGLDPGRLALFGQISVAGGAGLLVFVLYSLALRVPELHQSLEIVRSMVRRGRGGSSPE